MTAIALVGNGFKPQNNLFHDANKMGIQHMPLAMRYMLFHFLMLFFVLQITVESPDLDFVYADSDQYEVEIAGML
jgi:hypothetical protein